jgi:hypothetical protein
MTESVKVAVRDDNAGMIVMITLKDFALFGQW